MKRIKSTGEQFSFIIHGSEMLHGIIKGKTYPKLSDWSHVKTLIQIESTFWQVWACLVSTWGIAAAQNNSLPDNTWVYSGLGQNVLQGGKWIWPRGGINWACPVRLVHIKPRYTLGWKYTLGCYTRVYGQKWWTPLMRHHIEICTQKTACFYLLMMH